MKIKDFVEVLNEKGSRVAFYVNDCYDHSLDQTELVKNYGEKEIVSWTADGCYEEFATINLNVR